MPDGPDISSTLEDYLEAILRLMTDQGAARVRDIAKALSVSNSSVTVALQRLAEKQLVNYSPYELVTLTESGQEVAKEVYRRHEIIHRFLTEVLSVNEEQAEANACRMEHAVDRDVLDRLLQFLEFLERCPRAGVEFLRGFGYFCKHDEKGQTQCEECMKRCLAEYRKGLRVGRSSGAKG